jgi:hypothetical protein
MANTGKEFERAIGEKLADLRSRYEDLVALTSQYRVPMTSSRVAIIDFRLEVKFAHEQQNYYFELQSRKKHGHELADKIDAVRRDTALKTFSFLHELPVEESVLSELRARGVVVYDLPAFSRFIDGLDLQLGSVRQNTARAIGAGHDTPEERTRLEELARKLQGTEPMVRHLGPSGSSQKEEVVREIIETVIKNPDEALRFLKRFL